MHLVDMISNKVDNATIKDYINQYSEQVNDNSSRGNWTPLGVACDQGNTEIITYLLSKGANVENASRFAPCLAAVCCSCLLDISQKIKITELLLASGAVINAPIKRGYSDYRKGETPLDIAIKNKEHHLAEYLEEKGGLKSAANNQLTSFHEDNLFTTLLQQTLSRQMFCAEVSQFETKIVISTDETLQYDSLTRKLYRLCTPKVANWKYEEVQAISENLNSLCLVSAGITYCHTVIIKDQKGYFWVQHVSPAGILAACNEKQAKKLLTYATPNEKNITKESIRFNLWFCKNSIKSAYIDLSPRYQDRNIGLSEGPIDVTVIDNGGYFNEDIFRNSLPEKIWLNSLHLIDPKKINEFYSALPVYSVYFMPHENRVIISSNQKASFIEYPCLFQPLPNKHSFN